MYLIHIEREERGKGERERRGGRESEGGRHGSKLDKDPRARTFFGQKNQNLKIK